MLQRLGTSALASGRDATSDRNLANKDLANKDLANKDLANKDDSFRSARLEY